VNGSQKKDSGVVIILEGPSKIILEQVIHFTFDTFNNHTKYEALIVELKLARELCVK